MNIEERDRYYLNRIVVHCNRIVESRKRFGDSFNQYKSDADYRDVVCMNLFQIGELSNQISEGFKVEIQDVPWNQMYAVRNILAHAYI